MFNLRKNYRNLKRAKEIIVVFAKYGLGYFLNLPDLKKYFHFGGEVELELEKEKSQLSLAVRARLACAELGPTFIKLAQILSVRPDLIPPDFAHEFSRLQDEAPPFSVAEAKKIIKQELGRESEEIFAEFPDQPIAAASLSQVYRAKLKSGEVVAVKIQRPGIKRKIEVDLAILADLAKFTEKKLVNGYLFQPTKIISELKRGLRQELNFMAEGRNIDRFRSNFDGWRGEVGGSRENSNNSTTDNKDFGQDLVKIPKVYWSWTSGKVLTMEYIAGQKISAITKAKAGEYDRRLLARRGAQMVLKQIFQDGFFHADPHPGNIFVLPGNRLALLDFGLVGRLDEETKAEIGRMLIGVLSNDMEKIIQALVNLDIVSWSMDWRSLKVEFNNLLSAYLDTPLKQINIGAVIEDIVSLMARHRLAVPPDLSLLAKALVTIEGVGRDLDPNFNLVAEIKPFAFELIKKNYSLGYLKKKTKKTLAELISLSEALPRDLLWLIDSLKKERLNIGLKHRGLDKMATEINRASNRLAFSLIIAALIIGSSLVLTQKVGPYVFGYPAIGIIGYLLASFFGFFLIISILRSGKWK